MDGWTAGWIAGRDEVYGEPKLVSHIMRGPQLGRFFWPEISIRNDLVSSLNQHGRLIPEPSSSVWGV